jgi:hypothetical protein
MWYRVFCASDVAPSPESLLQTLNERAPVTGHFHGDEAGWFRAEIVVAGTTLILERFLANEDGIRAELNCWAAHLESCGDGPVTIQLMERMIQTRQLFTLECPDERLQSVPVDGLCMALCRFLASSADGVYQIDARGFFAADGTLLAPDE